MLIKFISIFLIFAGESIAIFAEVISSKMMTERFLWGLFGKSLSLMIFGCILLLFGYVLGVRSFQNIWIVSVASITSILISEPILNFVIFNQVPTKGAVAGLILGVIGLGFAIF